YTLYNVLGGVAWIWSMLLTGYFLGYYIPGIDKHIEIVIVAVIALSLLPGVIAWLRARSKARSPAVSDAEGRTRRERQETCKDGFRFPNYPTRTMRSSRTSTRARWRSITPSIIRRTSTT